MEFQQAREGSEELRGLVQRLHILGFCRPLREERVRTLRKALQVYKAVYGDVNVAKVKVNQLNLFDSLPLDHACYEVIQ